MTNLTKNNLFKVYASKPETPLDKTTRVVRQMVDDEAEQRQTKIARLRNARLEKEANSLPKAKAKAAAARKSPSVNTASKR